MEFGPILRALSRNKLGVILIALQIAFTMTVIVNAVFIINQRGELMQRPSGLDEASLFHLRSIGFGQNFNEETSVADDLSRLRQTPGIVDATVINALPVSDSGSSSGFTLDPGNLESVVPSAIYYADHRSLNTMGLELIAGVDFEVSDVLVRESSSNTNADSVIITQALAEQLFPDGWQSAVGQSIYTPSQQAIRIIGIVRRLQAPWPQWSDIENSAIFPEIVIDGSSLYLIRTEPGEQDRLMPAVEEMLAASNPQRILRQMRTMAETREESYRIDSVMTRILTVVIATLVFITAMGIVGLAVFSINRRRKQIGTRRALGATRGAILRYFLLENVMISSMGVVFGAVLTIGFNMFLVQTFNMPRIDWYYTPAGMLALILVGLLAVIGPSRAAARITPALATRSV
ncbi:MAG: FtsX-like permease family protein [Pseudohongiella sp.]|uniref:ABC transporter permease n=1 Tax=Pseudohongiella sp. TaxID=1979412 RepID=UPI00349FDEB5